MMYYISRLKHSYGGFGIKLSIGVDGSSLVHWLDLLIKYAENKINNNGCDINPEEILEGISS